MEAVKNLSRAAPWGPFQSTVFLYDTMILDPSRRPLKSDAVPKDDRYGPKGRYQWCPGEPALRRGVDKQSTVQAVLANFKYRFGRFSESDQEIMNLYFNSLCGLHRPFPYRLRNNQVRVSFRFERTEPLAK